ncbi:hypothetical protein GGR07_000168 [Bacteroides pyogenes]|nr:hypothetical protein [Bacteroides pyogenes]SUV33892.1 Uncharacterised protein [Bacteroides pyogenes]
MKQSLKTRVNKATKQNKKQRAEERKQINET